MSIGITERVLRHETDRGGLEPGSRAWQVVVDLGWHPQAELRPEERGYYQALWALADEARDAEWYAGRLGRRASVRSCVSSVLTAAAAVLSAVAGLGTVGTLIGSSTAGWIALAATAAAGGSASMQGVARGLGSLRVEQRAWEQYAEVIADDVTIMAADRSLDSEGRGRWAADRLTQARREAPDYLARRPGTSGS
ncbi:hypothetical protein GCM10009623_15790 [Nocardioides aestuarii]|uniref:SLATT domain-containing protein n=1 Tax=Nocardioides aestuarii TaxID=252231 RepID=A0ABW4TME2_9ACTN